MHYKYFNYTFTLTIAFILSQNISYAQNFTYAVGAQYYAFKGNNGLANGIAPGGFSPCIGITYHIEGAKLPLSIGLNASLFQIKQEQNHSIPVWTEDIFYNYTYKQQLSFVQIQMPITYHFQLKNANIFAGLNPTIYWNTKYSFDWEIDDLTQYNFRQFGKGVEYHQPEKYTANIDINLGYQYFFSSKGKKQFGLQASVKYPLLKMQNIYTNYTHDIVTRSGDKETYSLTKTSNFTPYSFGISVIMRTN